VESHGLSGGFTSPASSLGRFLQPLRHLLAQRAQIPGKNPDPFGELLGRHGILVHAANSRSNETKMLRARLGNHAGFVVTGSSRRLK
jgi:hypothetical protein